MRFNNPLFFLLLIPIALLFWWQLRHRHRSTLLFSDISRIQRLADRKAQFLSMLATIFRWTALIVMVIALARPQGINVEKEVSTQGLDMVLAMDVSGSMRAEDFKPDNRLEVAKKTVKEFISKRESDRIGLVVFGTQAFTQCPLTLDYGILQNLVDRVEIDMAGSGTAIGMSIVTGLNRLKNSDAKSKVIILLTDGENNSGEIDPMSAARLAADMNVKVFTIGVGKEGGAPIPIDDPQRGRFYVRDQYGNIFLTKLDEETLKKIAAVTNGQYFRAKDSDALKQIFTDIDELEKSEIKTKQYQFFSDYFMPYLWIIFLLLLGELIIRNGLVVKLP